MDRTRLENIKEKSELEPTDIQFLVESLEFYYKFAIEMLNDMPLPKKFKKDIPTVIEWQGRRYILDDSNRK